MRPLENSVEKGLLRLYGYVWQVAIPRVPVVSLEIRPKVWRVMGFVRFLEVFQIQRPMSGKNTFETPPLMFPNIYIHTHAIYVAQKRNRAKDSRKNIAPPRFGLKFKCTGITALGSKTDWLIDSIAKCTPHNFQWLKNTIVLFFYNPHANTIFISCYLRVRVDWKTAIGSAISWFKSYSNNVSRVVCLANEIYLQRFFLYRKMTLIEKHFFFFLIELLPVFGTYFTLYTHWIRYGIWVLSGS